MPCDYRKQPKLKEQLREKDFGINSDFILTFNDWFKRLETMFFFLEILSWTNISLNVDTWKINKNLFSKIF